MLDIKIIVEVLEMTDDMNRFFLDLETMETVCLSDLDPSLMVETATLIDEHPDRFLALPTRRQINEYGMMEDFINQYQTERQNAVSALPSKGKALFDGSRIQSTNSESRMTGLHSEMQLIIASPVAGAKRMILNTCKR